MVERTNCSQCDASILESTATDNGGLCAPCKGGFRDSIEDGKRRRQLEKQYDPFRELWVSLVKRVHNTELGYSSLTPDEKLYFAVGVMDGDVINGGTHQYFSNSSGDFHDDAMAGLDKLGATKTRKLMERACLLLFDYSAIPKTSEERWEIMKNYPEDETLPLPDWCDEFERIDTEYYTDPDSLNELLLNFATATGIVSPFLTPNGGANAG